MQWFRRGVTLFEISNLVLIALLGQIQLIGGLLIVVGVVLVRVDELRAVRKGS